MRAALVAKGIPCHNGVETYQVSGDRLLSLESPHWAELQHAYGSAADIPNLLKRLTPTTTGRANAEPWFSLWSALAHQGDVYSASFAAVPHVVRVWEMFPLTVTFDFLSFPAWVEACRVKKGVNVPSDLAESYFAAIRKMPALVAASLDRSWDRDFLLSAVTALAAGKGFPEVASAIDELDFPS